MDIERNYQATLDYLYSYVDFSLSRMDRYTPELFTLDAMLELIEVLGYPDQRYPTIHIAGTKGKGSVSAFCSGALQAAGYRVGLYTSPHLHDYAERIKLNGTPIAHQLLVTLVDELRPIFESVPKLTTFEITTALALKYFEQEKVDAAVIEVGLGGRLDATNIITPVVSVITSLSYDHTYLLGNTLSEIAREKAGIIKPGVPVVLAPQENEARRVIQEISLERSAPLLEVGTDYRFHRQARSLEGQDFTIWPVNKHPRESITLDEKMNDHAEAPVLLSIPLLGDHQIENAATAYVALQLFHERGLLIDEDHIREGFAKTHWPARFEILQRFPPVVVDAAHNHDSARRLRETLDDFFPGKGVILVFGASEDKDIQGMIAELMPKVDLLIATMSYHPRAMSPEDIKDAAVPFKKPVKVTQDIADAFNEALSLVNDEQLVLVTGSLFIAAGGREAWLKHNGLRVYA